MVIGEPIPFSEFKYDPEGHGEYARITNMIFDRICTIGENFNEDEAKALLKSAKKSAK